MDAELALVEKNWKKLYHVKKPSRAVVLAAVKKNGKALKYAKDFIDDREIVLTAVKKNGIAIKMSSDRLKGDKEVVLAAVRQNGFALMHSHMRHNKDVVLAAVRQNGNALEYATDTLKRDVSISIAAVSKNGRALRFSKCTNNPTVVMEAVEQDGSALVYSSLRNNKKIAECAIKTYSIVHLLSYKIQNDYEFILNAVKIHPYNFFNASEKLRNDRRIAIAAVSAFGRSLEYASEFLRDDYEVVEKAVENSGFALKYASKRLKNNKDIVLAAVKQNGLALQYASDILQENFGIVLAAVRQNGYALKYLGICLHGNLGLYESFCLCKEEDVILTAIKTSGCAVRYAHMLEKSVSKEWLIEAIRLNHTVFKYINEWHNDKDLALETVRQSSGVLKRAYFKKFAEDAEIQQYAALQDVRQTGKKRIRCIAVYDVAFLFIGC